MCPGRTRLRGAAPTKHVSVDAGSEPMAAESLKFLLALRSREPDRGVLAGPDRQTQGGAISPCQRDRVRVNSATRISGGPSDRASRGTPEARSPRLKRFSLRSLPVSSSGYWCPGAESNHRHGDFQSLSAPRRKRASLLGTSVKHVPRPVKAGTPKHGHARSAHLAGATCQSHQGAAGGSRRPAHRWRLPNSRSTTSSRSRSETTRPASASASPSRTASSMQRTGIAFTAPCGAASDPVRFRKFPPGSPCRAPPSPAVRGGARFLPPAPRGPRGAA